MVATRIYLPALRGRLGDWAFYSALMTLNDLSERVTFAERLHKSKNLSQLMQRELKEGRSKDIASYLTKNDDRFFSSLVVAVYGGAPKWNELKVQSGNEELPQAKLSETALYSVGYLSFTAETELFALDGQHRLAGIQEALKANPNLGSDEVSVLFVGHLETPDGLRRTRKLFTTLNKQAKSVKKSEIIALDEADVMAISTRHLVEEHKYFNGKQIDVMKKTPNLGADDVTHFTTIINIYDTLHVLFGYVKDRLNLEQRRLLEVQRPDDLNLQEYKNFAAGFYEALGKLFPDVQEYFDADDGPSVLKKKRSGKHCHILFRPIGLKMFAEVLKVLRAKHSYKSALTILGKIPTDMSKPPYAGTVWIPQTRTIQTAKAATCRDLLLFMIGEYRGSQAKLLARYKRALGLENDATVTLPQKI